MTEQQIEEIKRKANAGDAEAQYNLGVAYQNGQGVPKNHIEAAKWFRKAAEQKHAKAQNLLGAMYRDGQGGTLG